MEQLIFTTKGNVPLSTLEVTDHYEWNDNSRVHATEWRLNGELVRRDVNVNILRGLELGVAQGSV
jgi:hypothetical protein